MTAPRSDKEALLAFNHLPLLSSSGAGREEQVPIASFLRGFPQSIRWCGAVAGFNPLPLLVLRSLEGDLAVACGRVPPRLIATADAIVGKRAQALISGFREPTTLMPSVGGQPYGLLHARSP